MLYNEEVVGVRHQITGIVIYIASCSIFAVIVLIFVCDAAGVDTAPL